MKKTKVSKQLNVLKPLRKKFDPRRCPYKQIMEHNGLCMITVFDATGHLGKKLDLQGIDRLRITQDNQCYYSSIRLPDHYELRYYPDRKGWGGKEYDESCFVRSFTETKAEVIGAMKNYDRRQSLTIVNIDFYPKHKEISREVTELGYEDV